MFGRRLIVTAVSAGLLLGATACGSPAHNDLMNGASPATSCLTLYYFDGTTGYRQDVCDQQANQQLIDQLSAVKATPAPDWTLDRITMPIYGIDIGTYSGFDLLAVWSNGYWIDQNGAAYRFRFNFAQLAKDAMWSDPLPFSGITGFPCARWLVQDQAGWRAQWMTPAATPAPPAGLTVTLQSWDADNVAMTVINNSGEDWYYGADFALQVKLDDVWYDMPPVPGNWGVPAILYCLMAGATTTLAYSLSMYGTLPAGDYRLVKSELTLEHTISG